jgi:hypothetical protein
VVLENGMGASKKNSRPSVRINTTHILLETHLRELGLIFVPEYRFDPKRQWKADYLIDGMLWDGQRILVEIEGGTGYFLNPRGGVTRGGRHSRKKGYEEDCRKYNSAQALGYKVFRFTTGQVNCGEAKAFLKENGISI